MPLIPGKLSFLPDFEGREDLYNTLSPNQGKISKIRVLTVHPNRNEAAPLDCSLQIVSLEKDTKPKYNAISYF